MTKCARPGCNNPIADSPTRPAKYCSAACKSADYREREAEKARMWRALHSAGVFSLLARVRDVLAAWRGDGDLDAALRALAAHPLAGSQATAEKNGLTSLQARAGNVLAYTAGPGEGDDISTEMTHD